MPLALLIYFLVREDTPTPPSIAPMPQMEEDGDTPAAVSVTDTSVFNNREESVRLRSEPAALPAAGRDAALPSPPPPRAEPAALPGGEEAELVPPPFCREVPPHCGLSNKCATPATFKAVDPATVTIDAEGGCYWSNVGGSMLEPGARPGAGLAAAMAPYPSLCTHNPREEMVAGIAHGRGSWVAPEEYAAFLQAACSPTRPFMLDVGTNVGSYAVPAASLGCHVVAVDPVMANLGRVVESVKRLGALDNATFYNNFAGSARGAMKLQEDNKQNFGGMTFIRGASDAGDSKDAVSFVVLDELFEWEGRPLSPITGRPFQPSEVSFIKVDAEGCDLEVLYGAQRLLQRSPVPFLTVEFLMDGNCLHPCSGPGFVNFMYDLGCVVCRPVRVRVMGGGAASCARRCLSSCECQSASLCARADARIWLGPWRCWAAASVPAQREHSASTLPYQRLAAASLPCIC